MAGAEVLHPDGDSFDSFLYAFVGEDRSGAKVTVVSALSRLDIDPWQETAELAKLDRKGAVARLGLLLSQFKDVPALAGEHGPVAERLVVHLPPREATRRVGASPSRRTPVGIRAALAIMLGLVFLIWVFILANSA